jgi:cytochrome b
MQKKPLYAYHVWSRSVRIFHWINVISTIGLIFIGLAIFYNKDLGVSADGKILLKTIHIYIGYVFALNFFLRITGLFLSNNKFSHWKAIIPFGKKHRASLKSYVKESKAGNPPNYLGHNPIARLMIAFLFVLITLQTTTGLMLAGTDLYYPPFGNTIAEWVAEKDENNRSKEVSAGSKNNVDPEAYQEMRAFRKPFIMVHVYVFYLLLMAIFLHIAAVAIAEVRERSGLVSAMFTGNKVFFKKPVDLDD